MVSKGIERSLRCPLPRQWSRRQRINSHLSNLLSLTDSRAFHNCTPAQQNNVVADCVAAEITRETSLQRGTHLKQTRAWNRWGEYNKSIGNSDFFLESFSKHQRIKIIDAFAMAVREGWFSGQAYDLLVESTVESAVSYVCMTFQENGYQKPSLDKDARTGSFYKDSIEGLRMLTPQRRHQTAIPMCVIDELEKKKTSKLCTAIFQLTCLVIFFACRSCEYLKVPAADQQKTTILQLRKHQILQRRQAHQSQWLRTRVFRLRLVNLQKTEERQKDGYNHANGIRRHTTLSGLCCSRYHLPYKKLPKNLQRHPRFSNYDQQQNHTCHVPKRHRCFARRGGSNRGTLTRDQERGNRHALD